MYTCIHVHVHGVISVIIEKHYSPTVHYSTDREQNTETGKALTPLSRYMYMYIEVVLTLQFKLHFLKYKQRILLCLHALQESIISFIYGANFRVFSLSIYAQEGSIMTAKVVRQ